MAHNQSWLPNKRVEQLAMAKTWHKVLGEKGEEWKIAAEDISELSTCIEDADKWLDRAATGERSAVITARCKDAFDNMVGVMRNIKTRNFFSPPLSNHDFVSLHLKPKDTIRTPVADPEGQATASITYPSPWGPMFSAVIP